ncbi:MAG TPA: AIPR family protein [bacterium]|nr:AIPR family protein [bacterium]
MVTITQADIDAILLSFQETPGAVSDNAFALLYLEKEFKATREQAAQEIFWGRNEYGVDAFHIDPQLKNLYLFQFRWSQAQILFRVPFQRLVDVGMDRVFGQAPPGVQEEQFFLQLKSQMLNYQGAIERVFIHLVFNGDPQEAERSMVYEKLREDLESKKYLVDQFFGRPVTMVFQFLSAESKKLGAIAHQRVTHRYPLHVAETLERGGPAGEVMWVSFARLMDLHAMFKEMNYRFFERNIRASLSEDAPTNRSIYEALEKLVLKGEADPAVFAFHHNGVTLFAEKIVREKDQFILTEPRLLNGAQSITTLDRFLRDHQTDPALKEKEEALKELWVMCKIITDARNEFALEVAINNNRQNPVKPWNLHANDMIQLELQDKLREDLGLYYERQEKAFSNLTPEDLEELEIKEGKAVEMLKLAQTFLASDGELDKMSRLQEVFEEEKDYEAVFSPERLRADSKKVILCYKAHYRLTRLIREIMEKGEKKYAYMRRARNLLWALLCQAILNDERVEEYAGRFGRNLAIENDYVDWLAKLASAKARFLISAVVDKEPYASKAADERYGFLRTKAIFDQCMDQGKKRFGWVMKRLVC